SFISPVQDCVAIRIGPHPSPERSEGSCIVSDIQKKISRLRLEMTIATQPRRGEEKTGGIDFRLLTSDFNLSITFSLQTYTNQVLGNTFCARIAVAPAARRSQA